MRSERPNAATGLTCAPSSTAKCGRCSEDCKYCAQSVHYHTSCTESYPLLPTEELLAVAKHNEAQGVLRYSIVTSGKRLSDAEVDQVCESIRAIRSQTNLGVCASPSGC